MRVYKNIFLIITAMVIATITAVAYTNEYKLLDVRYSELTKDAKRQVDCLAENIYHEAGHEPNNGKVAVALVTLNRVQDPRYPKDICSVVKQKVNYTCQFSWFCMPVKLDKSGDRYREALETAIHVYANYEKLEDFTYGALFYHADYVNPRWKLQKTTVIGRHIFYKEGGNQK
jgi:spore germination cell wall hydrolase CwlJ-like protein